MDKTEFARQLRKDQTKAEAKLWKEVRNRQFFGLKYKRQVPINKYIVDFCCENEKLIVELDGDQHAEARKYDATRTEVLEDLGYRVLRFWNGEVFDNLDGVFAEMERFIGDT